MRKDGWERGRHEGEKKGWGPLLLWCELSGKERDWAAPRLLHQRLGWVGGKVAWRHWSRRDSRCCAGRWGVCASGQVLGVGRREGRWDKPRGAAAAVAARCSATLGCTKSAPRTRRPHAPGRQPAGCPVNAPCVVRCSALPEVARWSPRPGKRRIGGTGPRLWEGCPSAVGEGGKATTTGHGQREREGGRGEVSEKKGKATNQSQDTRVGPC